VLRALRPAYRDRDVLHVHGDGSAAATINLSRPYASSSVLLIMAIAAVAAYGFYASRGNEPLFGRPLLD
jgi:hypothetical protein